MQNIARRAANGFAGQRFERRSVVHGNMGSMRMSKTQTIRIVHRAPVSIDHELRWLEPGKHTLPAGVARMLIDHGHAEEIKETEQA